MGTSELLFASVSRRVFVPKLIYMKMCSAYRFIIMEITHFHTEQWFGKKARYKIEQHAR